MKVFFFRSSDISICIRRLERINMFDTATIKNEPGSAPWKLVKRQVSYLCRFDLRPSKVNEVGRDTLRRQKGSFPSR